MSKQFVKGNVYVFSKKAFLREERKRKYGRKNWEHNKGWVNFINGRMVSIEDKLSGNIFGMSVFPQWCKCVENNIPGKREYIYIFDYERFRKDMKRFGLQVEATKWTKKYKGKEVVLNGFGTGHIKESPCIGVHRDWCKKIPKEK